MIAPVNRERITWAHRAGPWALFLCALLLTLSSASPTSAAEVTRGPYLQQGTPSDVVVRWRTDVPTDSRVLYGTQQGNLTSMEEDFILDTEHEMTLSGLSADTKYYYAIGTTTEVLAGDDPDHFFLTSPATGTVKPMRIWLLSDSGFGSVNQAAVRDAYLAYTAGTDTNLWLHSGDISQSTGTDEQYQTEFFDMYPSVLRNTVFWPTFGNHDAGHANSAAQSGPYYENFTLPTAGESGGYPSGTEAYYSFDYANVHFVVLNSVDLPRSPGSLMLLWLANDLASTAQDWIIASWHHPAYSKGSHDSDTELNMVEMRQYVVPVLEDYGVDMAFSGHTHDYERTFLIDGHYGDSTTFVESHKVDGGDGREDGDGIYEKPELGTDPHEGTVYHSIGTGGQARGGPLDHPAMYISLSTLGSMVLDINGNRLDARFLDDDGVILDYYSIKKGCDDGDSDGACDVEDNCPTVANSGQEDADSDDAGDVCDDCTDLDSDGYGNPGYPANTCALDNCPADPNPTQVDADSDSDGDACDACINDPLNDIDSDTICGDVDLCPSDPDNDIDSDSLCAGSGFNPPMVGEFDNCPTTWNPNQTDSDSDGRGDVCDATQGVTVLKRLTMAGVADRMSSFGYIMNVTSAPVAGTSGVCPAGTTGSLGFWSFKAPTGVPVLLTVDKTPIGGSGQYNVELTWTGRSTQFEIYRNTSPNALIQPGNLWRTTNLCDETDQNANPFDILFYSVIE